MKQITTQNSKLIILFSKLFHVTFKTFKTLFYNMNHFTTDMYLVSLETSASSAEIGVSGPCLLRIQDGAIVLYSECGRNRLHHWAAENIKNLSISGEQLFLEAYK